MIVTLHTETVLEIAHRLEGYAGNCQRTHGHSVKVELWFRGDSALCDKVGILVDFGIVKELKDLLDHQCINDLKVGIVGNPTAENMAVFIYNWLGHKMKQGIDVRVRFYETAVGKETWCECGDF